MEPQNTFLQGEDCLMLRTEATGCKSTAADKDEDDASLAKCAWGRRTNPLAMSRQSHSSDRHDKDGSLWLMTSKSIARALDIDAKVVSPKKLKPLAETLETKTRHICEKLTERSCRQAWKGLGSEQ